MNQPLILIILGRAGCGKGTQAKLLKDKLGLIYIGSGELLRQRAKMSDFTGRKLEIALGYGNLAPTTLIFQLWINRLEEIKKSQESDFKGLIFDGSPRKIIEAHLLSEALNWYEWDKNIKALLIDISRQETFDRLTKRRICQQCGQLIPYLGHYKDLEKCDKCGGQLQTRADDKPEAINQRLDLFEKEVMPAVEFYKNQGMLLTINGEQSIEKVHESIVKALIK